MVSFILALFDIIPDSGESAMDTSKILELINANPVCHLATSEGDHPHVRAVFIFKADENGIIFHTGARKSLHAQLQKNPSVEFCFNDLAKNIQVRVQGQARFTKEPSLIREIITHPTREFLKPWIEEHGTDILAVYCIDNCQAAVWTMETNFEPTTFAPLK
jgi:pyridoxamine 5'-phosphate oxidase